MRLFRSEVGAMERRELESLLRRQFVVRGEDEFLTSFDPAEGGTLQSAIKDLIDYFHGDDGDGYARSDMVVWQNGLILAVVREGKDGRPEATIFAESRS